MRAPLSRPFCRRFGPVQASPTICMCQWARRLSCVKLASISGARSALRRWSCSNCERRCQRIHCVHKYKRRFNLHVQGKTTFISPTCHRRDSRDWCFWPARVEKDNRASHKRRQKSWNLARGGKVMRAGHRRGGGVGGWEGEREGGLTTRCDIRAVELQPDFKTM